jgi:hypothetical protein
MAHSGLDLLEEHVADQFHLDDGVYLAGLAEVEPTKVYYTSAITEIPAFAKRPIREYKWAVLKDKTTLKEIRERPPTWWYYPRKPVLHERDIKVTATIPAVTPGGRRKAERIWIEIPHEYTVEAGEPAVKVSMAFSCCAY